MESPRANLNVYISWPATALLLGLKADDSALPVRMSCPLCRGSRFGVYDDPLGGGPWFHCPDCHRAGDLIELAAAVWGVALPTAVDKLARLGTPFPPQALLPEHIADYLRDYPGYRQRLATLWAEARAWLPRACSRTLGLLRAQLRLINRLDLQGWRQGPGQLLGALPHEEIEQCFCPLSTGQGGSPHAERYRLNPSRGRVFSGRGWDDVLVVPYYDLPGRICAFEFLGRSGTAEDRVFRSQRTWTRSGSNQYAPQPPHRTEAGLAGLNTIESSVPCLGRTVFALDDVFLALRLQVRHMQMSHRFLPLVCWHDHDHALTRTPWRLLAGRSVVFWAWRLEPRVLYQAIQADGLLVLAGPEDLTAQKIDHYMRLCSPLERLHKLRRQALPWREAVRHWAESQPDGVVEDLLFGLQKYRLDLHQVAEACGGDRIERLLPSPTPRPRSVQVGPRTVAERGDGWYHVGKGGKETSIMDAILRIDAARTEGGTVQYQGRVLFRDEEIPYTVAAATLERHPARWIREFLLRQGKGVVHVAPGVSGLIEIALKFHEPVMA